MTKFESEIKTILRDSETIFNKLSDLSNLEQVKDQIPQDKLKDLEFDADSIHFSANPVGKIGLRIVEKEPNKTIKFKSEKAPIDFLVWIQLNEVAENDTKMKITLKAELNMFIKGMVSKPLQEAVNKLADVISTFPF